MKFTVKRSKWKNARSFTEEETRLLNREGHMCCLGFVAKQCGAKNKDIQYESTPASIEKIPERLQGIFVYEGYRSNTPLSVEAMAINDDATITNSVRERKLKSLFKKYGHEIEFVP